MDYYKDSNKTPNAIALGFAIGTFIAILPTFGLGLTLGALILLFFHRVNKIWMLGAFVLWNPFVLVPLYRIGARLGEFIFTDKPLVVQQLSHWNQEILLTKRVFVGNTLLALQIAIASYVIIYLLLRYTRLSSQSDEYEQE